MVPHCGSLYTQEVSFYDCIEEEHEMALRWRNLTLLKTGAVLRWYFCFMDLLLLGIATPFVYGTSFGKRSGDISWQHLVALAGARRVPG